MSMQTGSIDADGLARTTDGKLYVTLGSGSTIDSPTFTGTVTGGVRLIAQSYTSVNAPADTSEDTLATITLPANQMGANGVVRIKGFWSFTNNANSKTLRVKFGGTAYVALALTTQLTSVFECVIGNAGATNSQQGYSFDIRNGSLGQSGPTTSAVDTTGAVTILITGQKASGADTLTLNGYSVEVLR